LWDYLSKTEKPILLYGMGNASKRILDELRRRGITVSGIFASDGFVRGHSFEGFDVISYSKAKELYGQFIVLLCFGTHLDDVIDNIKRIACEEELYAPDLPVVGDGLFTSEYAKGKEDDINWLKSILADDKSREVLDELISYRVSGKIDHLFSATTSDEDNMKILSLGSKEKYMDLGAYTGDTVSEFISYAGGYSKIYAVEPEERNFRKLGENTKDHKDIVLVNAAIGGNVGETLFTHGVGRGGSIGKGKTRTIKVETIDNILGNEDVSFIKMDLEGAEEEALNGGISTIRRCKPKMLIACYHRIDDFFTLPKLILSINKDYKIFLRKSKGLPCWEVNYYCI